MLIPPYECSSNEPLLLREDVTNNGVFSYPPTAQQIITAKGPSSQWNGGPFCQAYITCFCRISAKEASGLFEYISQEIIHMRSNRGTAVIALRDNVPEMLNAVVRESLMI